jgi:hypothetical protein
MVEEWSDVSMMCDDDDGSLTFLEGMMGVNARGWWKAVMVVVSSSAAVVSRDFILNREELK